MRICSDSCEFSRRKFAGAGSVANLQSARKFAAPRINFHIVNLQATAANLRLANSQRLLRIRWLCELVTWLAISQTRKFARVARIRKGPANLQEILFANG